LLCCLFYQRRHKLYNGTSVSTAGDVNGDGLDDLIVGAKYADPNNKESAGKTKPPVPLAIADRLIAVLSFLPKTT
jgi:hypothetical protein